MNILILDQNLEKNFQSLYCDVSHAHIVHAPHLSPLAIAFQGFYYIFSFLLVYYISLLSVCMSPVQRPEDGILLPWNWC